MSRFHFFPELNLLISDFPEVVDDRTLLDQLLRTYDHPDFRPGMDELLSFLQTQTTQVSADGLRDIARGFPRPGDRGATPNLVAVVTASQLGQGLSRLYGAYADRDGQVRLEVFSEVDEAADWLDQARGRVAGTTAHVARQVLASAP